MKGQVHLLKPKQFLVWCRPHSFPGNLTVTTQPSKTTCVTCLSKMRYAKGGKQFAVAHIPQRL